MKDRVPLYPGRVKLVPVPGQENTYDMVRADQPTQEGTPLNVSTLLSNETAKKLGLIWDKVEKPLSQYAEGDIVYLLESGVPTAFYVSKKNYESGLNGNGRTLLLRKYLVNEAVAWNANNVNTYAGSTLDNYFNQTYLGKLSSKVIGAAGQTAFYYTPGNGNNSVTTLKRTVFAPSITEIGGSDSYANVEGTAFPIAEQIQKAFISDYEAGSYWTRTCRNVGSSNAFKSWNPGSVSENSVTTTALPRPCITLPDTFTPDPVWFNHWSLEISATQPEENATVNEALNALTKSADVVCGRAYVTNNTPVYLGFRPKIVFIACGNATNQIVGSHVFNNESSSEIGIEVYNDSSMLAKVTKSYITNDGFVFDSNKSGNFVIKYTAVRMKG